MIKFFVRKFIIVLIGAAIGWFFSVVFWGHSIRPVFESEKIMNSFYVSVVFTFIFTCRREIKYRTVFKMLDHQKKEINNCHFFNAFLQILGENGNIIGPFLYNLDNRPEIHSDLAFEKGVICEPNCNIVDEKKLTRVRRSRVLVINESLRGYLYYSLFATEFFLYDVIADDDKWGDDGDYRKALRNKPSICCQNSFKKRFKRMVVLPLSEAKEIINNQQYRLRFEEYVQWHYNHYWDIAILVVSNASRKTLTLKSIDGSISDKELANYMDFIIIKQLFQKKTVFAQDSNQSVMVFRNEKDVNLFTRWYYKVYTGSLKNTIWRGKTVEDVISYIQSLPKKSSSPNRGRSSNTLKGTT